MVSKQLMGVWLFFDFCLLAAGGVALAFSIIWREPNMMVNLVLDDMDLTAGMVLGIALLVTFLISIGAIIQRNHVTLGLVILNWTLIVDAIGVIVIGSILWFFTLKERNNFHTIWANLTPATRLTIQDKYQCCGYFNQNDFVEFGGFCRDAAFVNSPEFLGTPNPNVNPPMFCVTPIIAFADSTLNNAFTTVYGFMAIILGLFLSSLCVISKRLESERFKKIDLKRGGKGFV